MNAFVVHDPRAAGRRDAARHRARRAAAAILAGLAAAALAGCTLRAEQAEIEGKDLSLVFLHTSDIHSRLLPYDMDVMLTDENLGLLQQNAPFGGISRLAAVVNQERRDNERMAYIDSGDVFQGAPIFNTYLGEPEFRALSQLGLDVFAIGNHEFDNGAAALVDKAVKFANFPMLGANYSLRDWHQAGVQPTGRIASPYTILNLKGLRVGVIGLAAISSSHGGNTQGIVGLRTKEIVQSYVDFLRPLVDLVVVASHGGYHEDLEYLPRTEGVDIVFGGHLHITLDPPNVLQDCDIAKLERERDMYRCDTPEKVEQRQRACLSREGCVYDDRGAVTSCGAACTADDGCEAAYAACVAGCGGGGCPARCAAARQVCACQRMCQAQSELACAREAEVGRYADFLAELDADIAELRRRGCHPRDVLLVHSGAFLRFIGRLAVTVRQCHLLEEKEVCRATDARGACTERVPRRCVGGKDGTNDWEVVSSAYKLIPVDKTLPDDGQMLYLLEPYTLGLYNQQILSDALGFTKDRIRRFTKGADDTSDAAGIGAGKRGDSALGNMLTDAMATRSLVWTDFSVTNSLGMRQDMVKGVVDGEQMNNIFPFENAITVMSLTGYEVQEMMDFVAQRSASRACQPQAQVSGLTATLNCAGCAGAGGNACTYKPYDGEACAQRVTVGGSGRPCGSDSDCQRDTRGRLTGEICTEQEHPDPAQQGKGRCWQPISCTRVYTLATNDYVANGGSGFSVLARNTTQKNLGIPLRDTAREYMANMPPCAQAPLSYDERLAGKAPTYVVGEAVRARLLQWVGWARGEKVGEAAQRYHELLYCKRPQDCTDKDNCLPYDACVEGVARDDGQTSCTVLCQNVERGLAAAAAAAAGATRQGDASYLECARALPDGRGDCLGLGCRQIKECETYAAADQRQCQTLGRIRAALRCMTLPCIQAQEDGRLQRVLPDSSGAANPDDPWPED